MLPKKVLHVENGIKVEERAKKYANFVWGGRGEMVREIEKR